MLRRFLSRLLLAAACGFAASARADEPPFPALHPEDEAFFLQMRKQLRGVEAPEWLSDAPREQRLEWFKNGLRQAAAKEHSQHHPENPSPADRPGGREPRRAKPRWAEPHAATNQPRARRDQPAAWRVLLESAMNLERIAHELDVQQLWDSATRVRHTAAKLREAARAQADPSRPRHAGDGAAS